MRDNEKTIDHNVNDDPFYREGPGVNRDHVLPRDADPRYADVRHDRFDADYNDVVDRPYYPTDADGFFNPMEDVLAHRSDARHFTAMDLPMEFRRELEERPEAMDQFRRLSGARRQQIINSLSRDHSPEGRREHAHNIVTKLIIENRRDVELGIE